MEKEQGKQRIIKKKKQVEPTRKDYNEARRYLKRHKKIKTKKERLAILNKVFKGFTYTEAEKYERREGHLEKARRRKKNKVAKQSRKKNREKK